MHNEKKMTAYCLKYGEPKRTQTIQGQTTQDVAGSNPDYVYREESEEESDEPLLMNHLQLYKLLQ